MEIGADEDHVHFLIQSVPTLSPTKIARTIKSITAREMFDRHAGWRQLLWGGKFWTSGFYINTVGKSGNADIIQKYVRNQGRQTASFIDRNPKNSKPCFRIDCVDTPQLAAWVLHCKYIYELPILAII